MRKSLLEDVVGGKRGGGDEDRTVAPTSHALLRRSQQAELHGRASGNHLPGEDKLTSGACEHPLL